MKKLMIATVITIVVLSGCAYSQQGGHTLAAANVKSERPKNNFINDINVRAMRDFVSRYGEVEGAIWHRSKDSFIAVFYRDSVQHRVIYSQRGDFSFVMKYYDESHMARNIRAQVKSTYYDYKIFIIQEIESPNYPTVYIVNLQGETDWKKVRLCQGDMEVMEEYKKCK
ncbi:MAG TPA: hypothetical protein VF008_28575 [Niastella sp.]